VTRINEVRFAESNNLHSVYRHIFFADQVIHHGLRAAAAQLFVVIRWTGFVRESLDGDVEALIRPELR